MLTSNADHRVARRQYLAGWRLVILSACVLGWSGQTFGQSSKNWTLNDVMQVLSGIRFIESSFVETKRSIFLTEELELKGTINYRAPDRLEKNIAQPFEERIVIDGDELVISRPGDENRVRRYSLDANPVVRKIIDSIRATLAGDLSILEQNYRANLWGEESEWELHLIPRDAELLEIIEQIRIRGAQGRIIEVQTTETDGDEATLQLTYNTVK